MRVLVSLRRRKETLGSQVWVMGLSGLLWLHFEPLRTHLEAVRGLADGLHTGRVVGAHRAFSLLLTDHWNFLRTERPVLPDHSQHSGRLDVHTFDCSVGLLQAVCAGGALCCLGVDAFGKHSFHCRLPTGLLGVGW